MKRVADDVTYEPGGIRNRQEAIAGCPETPTDRVISLRRLGTNAQEIGVQLGIPPSRLKRILAGRRVRQFVELQREVGRIQTIVASAESAGFAAQQLLRLLDDPSETTRKVCVAILNLVAGANVMNPNRDWPLAGTSPTPKA